MKKQNRFYLYCGILMLLSELWKQWCLTYILNHGQYNWWYFPFQLCSIPMYLCLVIPWIHTERLRGILITFLMNFGLLGGIFAFFDTSGMHYEYLPLTIHSYAWHILLITIGLFAGYQKKPMIRRKAFSGAHAATFPAVFWRPFSIWHSTSMALSICSISALIII